MKKATDDYYSEQTKAALRHGRDMYLTGLDYAISIMETFEDIEVALVYLKKRRAQKAQKFEEDDDVTQ